MGKIGGFCKLVTVRQSGLGSMADDSNWAVGAAVPTRGLQMVGEHLDLTSDVPRAATGGVASSSDAANAAAACGDGGGSRKFVGVRFECCAVYTRVYVNREETAYEGRCPRCARPVRLEIGPGGTDARFFSAY